MISLEKTENESNLNYYLRSKLMKRFEQSASGYFYLQNLFVQTVWRLWFTLWMNTGVIIAAGAAALGLANVKTVFYTMLFFYVSGWVGALIRQIHDFGDTSTTWNKEPEEINRQIKEAKESLTN